MAHDVFISYSSRDKLVADAACAALEAQRVRCWIAPRDVLSGARWGESIVTAIRECRLMVLVLSGNANTSETVKDEVYLAASRGIPILPFRIEDVQPAPAFELFIMGRHWLDAMTPPIEAHLERLAESVVNQIDAGAEPQRPVEAGYQPTSDGPPVSQRIEEPLVPETDDASDVLMQEPPTGSTEPAAEDEATQALESAIAERLDLQAQIPNMPAPEADEAVGAGDERSSLEAAPTEAENAEAASTFDTAGESDVDDKGAGTELVPLQPLPLWDQPRWRAGAAVSAVFAIALYFLLKPGPHPQPIPDPFPTSVFVLPTRSSDIVLPTFNPGGILFPTTARATAVPTRAPTTTAVGTSVSDLVVLANWDGVSDPIFANLFSTLITVSASSPKISAVYKLSGDAQVVSTWKYPGGSTTGDPGAGKAGLWQARTLTPPPLGLFITGDYEVTLKVVESGLSKTVKFTVVP